MFSLMTKDGEFGLRLPRGDRETFLSKYDSKLLEQYGIVQKEYVVVPMSLLKNTEELKTYFGISYDYVKSLKLKKRKGN
jgi:hypothetical protein